MQQVFRRECLVAESAPTLADNELRVRVECGPASDDRVVIIVDYVLT
jgi:hypothetical protein